MSSPVLLVAGKVISNIPAWPGLNLTGLPLKNASVCMFCIHTDNHAAFMSLCRIVKRDISFISRTSTIEFTFRNPYPSKPVETLPGL